LMQYPDSVSSLHVASFVLLFCCLSRSSDSEVITVFLSRSSLLMVELVVFAALPCWINSIYSGFKR